MKKIITGVLTACVTIAAIACAGDDADRDNTGAGGLAFRCEEGETFVLDYADDGDTAVLKMSGETRRLSLESSDGGLKYSNADMWLWTESRGSLFAEVEDSGGHKNCHASQED